MINNNIIKDILKIISIQKLSIAKKQNSILFILDDDFEYDLNDFRKKCNWVDLYQKEVPPNDISNGFHSLFELSEDFINFFAEDIGWYKISRNIKLNEKFIEENSDKVNWAMVSQFQNLSENFIERNYTRVSWSKISIGQKKLSEEFIWKYKNKLSINNVIYNNKVISDSFRSRLKELR
jgi:hypothetical protein